MLDKDLDRLSARDAPSLEGLEAAIWRHEAFYLAALRMARKLATWQAAILLLAVIASAGIGLSASQSASRENGLLLHDAAAPSTRLFGHRS